MNIKIFKNLKPYLLIKFPKKRGSIQHYLLSVLLMGIALLARLYMAPIDAGLQYITFFPTVTLSAVFFGFKPAILTTFLGLVFATFIMTPPYYSVSIEAMKTALWSNIVFLTDCLIMSSSIEAMHRYRNQYEKELDESKKSEAQVKELNKELDKFLNKEKEINRIKTSLINLTTHDLRTPLSIIVSSADILLSFGYELKEESKINHYHNIHNASNRIKTILEDISVYSKFNSETFTTQYQEINLKNFCENLKEEFELVCSATHKINFSYKGDVMFKIDTALLYHILINLLSNAYKYSAQADRIIFNVTNKNGKTIFEIIDFGIGISKDDIPKIFNEFYRAENTKKIFGTGIGLHLVKYFIDKLGGKIAVESKLNTGTKFTVIFE
ncbi:MAG: HAMP domain-containing histidine kinase [Leptospiraceae bacterium]|nr:HAMP domain-containing histidine kinase [Leptospiraceae bacterium]